MALIDKMARSQTVRAEIIVLDDGHHLLMRQRLELGTSIEWVFVVFARNTVHCSGRGGIGSEGGDRPVEAMWSLPVTPMGFPGALRNGYL